MIVGEGPGSCFTFLVCIVCKYRQRLDTVSLLWIRRVTKLAFGSHGNWEVLFPLGVLQIMKKNGRRALSQIIIPRRKEQAAVFSFLPPLLTLCLYFFFFNFDIVLLIPLHLVIRKQSEIHPPPPDSEGRDCKNVKFARGKNVDGGRASFGAGAPGLQVRKGAEALGQML